jgi:hypothetical protein
MRDILGAAMTVLPLLLWRVRERPGALELR